MRTLNLIYQHDNNHGSIKYSVLMNTSPRGATIVEMIQFTFIYPLAPILTVVSMYHMQVTVIIEV